MVLCGLAAVAVAAPPIVEIKAQTQLSMTKVALKPDNITEITGQLVDKFTGEGLPNERVTVRVGDIVREEITRQDGSFTLDIPSIDIDPGQVTITMTYRGQGAVDPAQPLVVTTDPSRDAVDL